MAPEGAEEDVFRAVMGQEPPIAVMRVLLARIVLTLVLNAAAVGTCKKSWNNQSEPLSLHGLHSDHTSYYSAQHNVLE
jgi:hypothetical protein